LRREFPGGALSIVPIKNPSPPSFAGENYGKDRQYWGWDPALQSGAFSSVLILFVILQLVNRTAMKVGNNPTHGSFLFRCRVFYRYFLTEATTKETLLFAVEEFLIL
jgi:hypothetical protein